MSEMCNFRGSGRRETGTARRKNCPPRPKKGVLQASGAITTPLVAHFFESVFGTQMADLRNQPKGCGKCQACKSVDCGSCSQCLSKKKFGGDIEDKNIICDRRQCENSELQMISQDESSNYSEKNTKQTNKQENSSPNDEIQPNLSS